MRHSKILGAFFPSTVRRDWSWFVRVQATANPIQSTSTLWRVKCNLHLESLEKTTGKAIYTEVWENDDVLKARVVGNDKKCGWMLACKLHTRETALITVANNIRTEEEDGKPEQGFTWKLWFRHPTTNNCKRPCIVVRPFFFKSPTLWTRRNVFP